MDETREVLKELELKASRTRIVVLWSLDRYEIRAERLQMAESIVQRLRDYVSDVEAVDGASVIAGSEVFDAQKHNLVIVCSRDDHGKVGQSGRSSRGLEMSLLRATPALRRG